MKRFQHTAALLILFSLIAGPRLSCQTAESATHESAQAVAVSQEEVENHRIEKHPMLRTKLDDPRLAMELAMEGIRVKVTVGFDGVVASAMVETTAGDVKVPEDLQREADMLVRALHYQPFKRNGRAVPAKFEEDIPVLPPELQPAEHVPFPEIRDWESVRITLERTACMGTCPVYSIEVHGDGTVLYDGQMHVAIGGKHIGSVPLQAVRDLVSELRRADYYSLQDEFNWGAMTCLACKPQLRLMANRSE